MDAWRALVTSHAAVTARVQRALADAALPPLSWFEVLRAVKLSPAGQPRMSELADWLTLSRGGITKLVDRLEQAGYLERVSCHRDRRSLRAELTPTGQHVLEAMHAVYATEVLRHLGTLTPSESRSVASALEKVSASTCDAASRDAAAEAPEAR